MPVSEQDFFREVTLRACGTLDIRHALEQVYAYVRDHVPLDAIGLGYSDLTTRRIEVVGWAGHAGARPLWGDEGRAIPLDGPGLAYVRDETAPSPLVVNRPDPQLGGLLGLFPGLQQHSAVFVRLQLSSEEIGAVLAWSRGADRFSAEHAALLEAVREPLTIAMVNARRYRELERVKERLSAANRELTADLRRAVGHEVVGADFGLRDVMDQVRRIAASSSPALLLGETGTGKEVIAHAIHQASSRGSGPMVTLQCGAVPETLLDSELFGHERGAFTGAVQQKRGRFERADGGTLFLDEIGELSLEAQVKLLRVLQERRFERVGGARTIEVDVRVIAATHRDLESMVREGTFREDLWYRLNVLPIRIPPVRLRRGDIPSLVHHFVHRKARELGFRQVPTVSRADLQRLRAYDWPGNVRELQNVVERALLLSSGPVLRFPSMGATTAATAATAAMDGELLTMDQAIASHLRAALDRVDWQVAGPGGAAEVLGMNPSTLRFRMKKLGIERPRRRRG